MNYLTFIVRIMQYNPVPVPVRFLVSGNDAVIRNAVLNNVYRKARASGRRLVIIDDIGSAGAFNLNDITSIGYQVKDGMSGESFLYNPFRISTITDISKMRQLLTALEYDEKRKMKLIAYLGCIKTVEELEKVNVNMVLTLETLNTYSTNMNVEKKLQNLLLGHVIDDGQHMLLLTKYLEICEAAADFEDMLFILSPFINGDNMNTNTRNSQAIVYHMDQLGTDTVMRTVITQLLSFHLETVNGGDTTVVVLDKGYGNRKYMLDFLAALPKDIDVHIFSEDIFTLCDTTNLPMIFNCFTARIFSRHLAMDSCQAIEKFCGEIDVVKNSYTETRDRRWKANKPWDILMGNNKTETYTQNVPTREPRYRKEMIAGFRLGSGIIEYMGNTSLFSV